MSAAVVLLVLSAVLCWPTRPVGPVMRRTRPRSGSGGRWLGRPRRSLLRDLQGLAEVAELIAMTLRSGALPTTAVGVVMQRAPDPWAGVLSQVHERLCRGEEAGEVWRSHARHRPELGAVAGAWTLSEELGVALAPSMAVSAQVLRDQVQAHRRLAAATSGARATMRMLTLLPMVGLLAGMIFGLTPWEVYGHSVLTAASAAIGLILTLAGWAIGRWVLARAVAPQVHR